MNYETDAPHLQGDDPEQTRDLGLIFRWRIPLEILRNARLPWTRDRLQNHAIGAIMAEALAAEPTGQAISVSLRKGWWTGKTLIGGDAFTYAYVRRALDILHREGWIVLTKAEPKIGGSGRQSTFVAGPELIAWYGSGRPLSYELRRPIFLRGADDDLLPLPDPLPRELERVRKRLDARNEAIGAVDLRIVAPDIVWTPDRPMLIDGRSYDPRRRQAHIVYNGDHHHGGRLYGLPYQTLNQRDHGRRDQLQMDGSTVTEPDFSGCHPRLLYHERGLEPDGDLYDVAHPVYGRPESKLGMQILLNASSEHQGIPAFAWKLARQEAQAIEDTGGERWTKDQIEERARQHLPDAQVLFDALKAKHEPIAGALFTGVGSRLQCKETAIMMRAGMDCLKQGVVVLPMHDSAITKSEHGELLIEAMHRAYAVEMQGFVPVISGGSTAH